MRLSKIKLAGFKSFVDPTTIELTSQRVAIVGPNGCGKSNTIDAVRWVMGESSAKYLRGESMEDVIFNGSSARKPVGQASVELVFDNSDGTLGGQYAQYAEIAVKRLAARDGQSQYFLNGTRCRRRDITDIFLGTGLGPRSYAIIEQGMITRLIEAKPEELRVYLEEAAGISKYKERRRETENRIRHTRENLERLDDLREEVAKHLAHLKRQAHTAERYKDLKGQERRLRAELIGLRLEELDAEAARREQSIQSAQNALEAAIAGLRARETELLKGREQLNLRNEALSGVQSRYYQIGGEITRTEQAIKHAEMLRTQRSQALEQAEAQLGVARRTLDADETKAARLQHEMTEREPALATAAQAETAALAAQEQADQAMREWQTGWDAFNQRAAEPAQRAQVERTRMEHLERQLATLDARRERLVREADGLDTSAVEAEIKRLTESVDADRARLEQEQTQLDAAQQAIEHVRNQARDSNQRLDEVRRELQTTSGRLASLEALQQSALGTREGGRKAWLEAHGLAQAPRLGESIRVGGGWERAVEAVLGAQLGAVCVERLDEVMSAAADPAAPREFIGRADHATGAGELAAQVTSAWPVADLLSGVRLADTLEDALGRRDTLDVGESFITPAGEWIGRSWLRLPGEDEEHAGILARGEEIARLQQARQAREADVAALAEAQERARVALRQHEDERTKLQTRVNEAHRSLAADEARLGSQRARLEQLRQRAEAIQQELGEIDERHARDREALQSATRARNQAVSTMEHHAAERETLNAQRNALSSALAQARQATQTRRDEHHRLALTLEGLRTELAATQQAVQRGAEQLTQLEQRATGLRRELDADLTPTEHLSEQLAALLEQRGQVDAELAAARTAVQNLETELREADRARLEIEREVEGLREQQNERRLALESVRVRGETLREQFAETGFDRAQLQAERAPEASIPAWEKQVQELEQRLQRLGAINLAAIEEYQTESERADYLDAQHADLTDALTTLEAAIGKIDRETRSRFRDTFERVNTQLKDMFPRLFGGGEARLEMTGDDLLSTGVAVLARPPGKRLSTINLMSGGEKALTAVALVFAIFELNPAPFCMLDEVDAPLDEANVGRFANLVRDMAERVQFIMITHNKVSMEAADHLIGVTMREPGVSRMVAVDLDEAARMAVS
ncbi:chromosome segregation protein SMC [Acidihalobacter ferrooxydans]|uniref:Chromosome partition protein Smc n=1 Tax=Acidihalobacter ferrooxydans TaxID=1765967 RepID=A0A1P8UHH0_9GAMM|nr:chromosome segregation protein SMC [Acidihalobacter ferrooxydans]APZ43282.1 chromosome segregation protein SMC [Acidihalobacter ferrooxydans]